ncbi:MAG: hypothetical protein ACFFBD_15230 [Candidatus Hodarchaeota archaeon]
MKSAMLSGIGEKQCDNGHGVLYGLNTTTFSFSAHVVLPADFMSSDISFPFLDYQIDKHDYQHSSLKNGYPREKTESLPPKKLK